MRAGSVTRLVGVWAVTAVLLVAWGLAARQGPAVGGGTGSGRVRLGELGRGDRVLALWVWWEGGPARQTWAVLEGEVPWGEGQAAFWQRRVHPGWNLLVWDDLRALPPGRSLWLRWRQVEGSWVVGAPRRSGGITLALLAPLRGLLLALGLALLALLASVPGWLSRARGPRSWAWPAGLAVLGVGAAALRLPTLGQSFWFDEVLTAIGGQSLAWVLHSPAVFLHPPLPYLVAWVAGAPHAPEVWLRVPFVVAGVGGVLALASLGRTLFGPATGLVAAGLLAASPIHVELSQLVRPYALALLVLLLSLQALLRALTAGRWTDWLAASATVTLALYTHHLAWAALAAEVVLAGLWLATRRGRGWPAALVSLAGVGALVAPWAPVPLRLAGAEMGAGRLTVPQLLEVLTRAVLLLESWGEVLATLALAACAVVARRRHARPLGVVACWTAVPLGLLWVLQPAHAVVGRHLAFLLPVLLLLPAHGLVAVAVAAGRAARALRRWPGAPRRAVALIILGGLVLGWYGPVGARLSDYYRWRRGPDWRVVAQILERRIGGADPVVATLGAAYPLRHYWRADVAEVDAGSLAAWRARAPCGVWVVVLEEWDRDPALWAWLERHAVAVGDVPPSWSLTSRLHLYRTRAIPGTPCPPPASAAEPPGAVPARRPGSG